MERPSSRHSVRSRHDDLANMDIDELRRRINETDRDIARLRAGRSREPSVRHGSAAFDAGRSRRSSVHLETRSSVESSCVSSPSSRYTSEWVRTQNLSARDRHDDGFVRQFGASAAELTTNHHHGLSSGRLRVDSSGPPKAERSQARQFNAPVSVLLAESPSGRHSAKSVVAKQTAEGPRRMLATSKLGTYDGSSPLESRLAKFNSCADYQWSARDRLCHLKASLEGHAGQVLRELGPNSTEKDVVQLLRNRF